MTHPPPEELEAYAAGVLPAERRPACEEHLSVCAECRARVVSRFLAGRGGATSTRWRLPRRVRTSALRLGQQAVLSRSDGPRLVPAWAVAVSVVAAVGLGAYFLATRGPGTSTPEALREDGIELDHLELRGPPPGAALDAGVVAFEWTPLVEATSYRLIVLDRNGDAVAELTTTEAAMSWPATDARLLGGETYYWYVVAELMDGTERESEIRYFRWLTTGS
jgi:hypothetical protein